MAVNNIIECFWRDLVPEDREGLESSVVYTAPPIVVESVHGRSNRSLVRLLLHMHAEDTIPAFLMSNIYIRICLPKALTLTQLRAYTMFVVLLIVRINKSVELQRILNFHLLRDAFLYRLARASPPKEGVPYPQQSKIRTPAPHLR